jgi:anti-sigma regulatory factor (Ser/Thr protein kinase)
VSEREELKLDLPAAHSASRMARQVVGRFALEHGVAEDDIGTLELVTSELLSNAVDHGGGGSAMEEADVVGDVRIKLWLACGPDGWELRVADQGGGDPEEMEPYLDDSELPDLEDERGRGFFLLVQMVDELTVARSEDGKGLEFVAIKKVG